MAAAAHGGKVSVWRPPARVWIFTASVFQPGFKAPKFPTNQHEARVQVELLEREMILETQTPTSRGFNVFVIDKPWIVDTLSDSDDEFDPFRTMGRYARRNALKRRAVREAEARQKMPSTLTIRSSRTPISVPTRLWSLTSLLSLTISFTNLVGVPKLIRHFSKLRELNLTNNAIRSLPEELGELTDLTYLLLFRNDLSELPESICRLRNLRGLQVYGNQLRFLPEDIGNLVNLEELDASDNRIKRLPASIGNLRDLRRLMLEHNKLRTIRKEIGSLVSLQNLDLSDNSIPSLPVEIGNLSKLRDLNLCRNELSDLPGSIRSLRKLECLNIKDNLFATIPAFLIQIPRCLVFS